MFAKVKPLWGEKPSFRSNYDAVIIGGGLHGLAAAYFLARDHNMRNVAVIEKRYMGFGGSGRNTAIVRANQRTQENVPLYKEALKLWPILTKELDYNLMFYNCGNLNLMHSEAAMNAARMNVATAQFLGVESHLIDAQQCKEMVPALNISEDITYPIFGAMYHPPGGILRHDAIVWGLAKGAAKHGVHIHQQTEVTGIGVENNKIVSVETNNGKIKTPRVLNAAGGYSPVIARMAGIRLPIESHVLHMFMLHLPDFLGYESAITMAADHGDVVKRALRIKKLGNAILVSAAGRAVHPVGVCVGGFHRGLETATARLPNISCACKPCAMSWV